MVEKTKYPTMTMEERKRMAEEEPFYFCHT
jgi:hypothetical protein